jgi:AcrR family transcriptional regulator
MQCYCINMSQPVKPLAGGRTRRSERAEQTRRRIIDAATALFDERGYSLTTIEAIAARADVAVETVYSRFRNKAKLLEATLEPAIVGGDDGRDLFDRPEIAEIRACKDQQTQLRLLARFSRGILERTYIPHRILRSAASSDPHAAELQRRDAKRRGDGQRIYIDMLLANGPLREGLTSEDAAATYSALSNPSTYALLVGERGWSADHFQQWLGDSLTRLLLRRST